MSKYGGNCKNKFAFIVKKIKYFQTCIKFSKFKIMITKFSLLIIIFLTPYFLFSQSDSLHVIKVHFLYGSKPLKNTKKSEPKSFGGLHGGHVTIEVDSVDYGFNSSFPFHIIAHKKWTGEFVKKYLKGEHRYKTGEKTVTFYIPISKEQYFKLNQIHLNYCNKTPYDYACLGMRCASATYDILSQIGVFKSKTQFFTILSTF